MNERGNKILIFFLIGVKKAEKEREFGQMGSFNYRSSSLFIFLTSEYERSEERRVGKECLL